MLNSFPKVLATKASMTSMSLALRWTLSLLQEILDYP
jgi:hypothetical protein